MQQQVNRRKILAAAIGGAGALSLPVSATAREAQPKPLARLNANENPYGPGPKARRAAIAAVEQGAYYGFSAQSELRNKIAASLDVADSAVVLSTGSNEALCAAVTAWGKEGHIIAPALTYSAHLSYARRTGAVVNTVPLRSDMSIDLDAMAAAVTGDTTMVYVCNPNNPTGLTIDGDELRAFCRRVGRHATVLVDEAYNELTEMPAYTSMLDLVRAGENVVVTKTFSKVYGLAGLRVGYALARDDHAQRLKSHVMSWPNSAGVAAATASLDDPDFVAYSKQKIADGRKIVSDTFARHGIKALPSATNFVYADIGRDAGEFAALMRSSGVIIGRVFQPYKNWARVSMGRLEDIRRFSRVFDALYPA